ncbi:unnamed protein product, partial [Ectocarpus sp. 12 AP-2014]
CYPSTPRPGRSRPAELLSFAGWTRDYFHNGIGHHQRHHLLTCPGRWWWWWHDHPLAQQQRRRRRRRRWCWPRRCQLSSLVFPPRPTVCGDGNSAAPRA